MSVQTSLMYEVPLSFAQERLWSLAALELDRSVYNTRQIVWLDGPVAVDALGAAFAEVVRRHDVLRTTFEADGDGVAVQRVHPAAAVLAALPRPVDEDVSALSPAELDAVLTDEGQRPFDLGGGPLFRVRLFRIRDDERILHVVMHQ